MTISILVQDAHLLPGLKIRKLAGLAAHEDPGPLSIREHQRQAPNFAATALDDQFLIVGLDLADDASNLLLLRGRRPGAGK